MWRRLEDGLRKTLRLRQLHPWWPQLYGQPKIPKLGAPIRPVVSFYNTPLSSLHTVLAHLLKPLANSSIHLKDTNDFKQHLNTTGHPNFPYHTSLDIKSLYTSCNNFLWGDNFLWADTFGEW